MSVDSKYADSAAHAFTIVNILKSHPKTLTAVQRSAEARQRSLDALNTAVGAAHTQLQIESDAAALMASQLRGYALAMTDFKLFMDGKPPAPKKSAYELKEEARQKEIEERKSKFAAEEAVRAKTLKDMDAAQKVEDETYTDVLNMPVTVHYKSKAPGAPAYAALVEEIKDAIRASVRDKSSNPDNEILLNHLRTVRVKEYASTDDALAALRLLLLHYALESRGAVGAPFPRRVASGLTPERYTELKNGFDSDWALVWALNDRCLRDTEAKLNAVNADAKATETAKEEALAMANTVLDLAMDVLARRHDSARISAMIDRALAAGSNPEDAVAKLSQTAAVAFSTSAAMVGRWKQFRAFKSKMPEGSFESFHRTALNNASIPDLQALDKMLVTGKDGKGVRDDADQKDLHWHMLGLKKLHISYKDGTSSDPALLQPVEKARDANPNGQDIPHQPGSTLIRTGASGIFIIASPATIAPLCGVVSSTSMKLHGFIEAGAEAQEETYELTRDSVSADGKTSVWKGSYTQSVKLGKDKKGKEKTMKLTFDATVEFELEE